MGRRAAIIAAAAAVLAFAWGTLDSLRPFVTFEHDAVESTPALGALESRFTVTMKPGDETCIQPVTLTPRSEVARFRVLAAKGRPVPIVVTASGDGYRSSAVIRDYAAPGDQLPLARLTPPDRELQGRVCARNAGRQPVELVGTDEIRSQVVAETIVNGEPQPNKEIELTLLQEDRRSWLARTGELVGHARAFGADFTPEWLLWIVLVLAALGIPAAAIAGFFLAVREDDAPSRG